MWTCSDYLSPEGCPSKVGKAPGPGKVKKVLKKSSCSAGKRKTRKSRGLMIRPHDVKFATLETRFCKQTRHHCAAVLMLTGSDALEQLKGVCHAVDRGTFSRSTRDTCCLFVVVCCCLLLFVVVCCCLLLLAVVGQCRCLLNSSVSVSANRQKRQSQTDSLRFGTLCDSEHWG